MSDFFRRFGKSEKPLIWTSSITRDYNDELKKFLLSKKADINVPDSDGTTPLHYKSRQSSNIGPALNDFGKMGANLTATDGYGWTAVEHMPNYLEVVGSLPTGSWAFLSSSSSFYPFLLSTTSEVSSIRSLQDVHL